MHDMFLMQILRTLFKLRAVAHNAIKCEKLAKNKPKKIKYCIVGYEKTFNIYNGKCFGGPWQFVQLENKMK